MEFYASTEKDRDLVSQVINNKKEVVKNILSDPDIQRVDFVIWLSNAAKAQMRELAED